MGTIISESVEQLVGSEESFEKNKKQKEYLLYIENHKLNVMKAFNLYFLPLLEKEYIGIEGISDEELKDAIKKCAVNIVEHDASKYSDDEFDGYREKYYPTSIEKADEEFQKKAEERAETAWESHYKNNPHHPLYWKDETTGEFNNMQLEYIIEMICDWCSFSLAKGDIKELFTWYEKEADKEKSQMTDWTRLTAEKLMQLIK